MMQPSSRTTLLGILLVVCQSGNAAEEKSQPSTDNSTTRHSARLDDPISHEVDFCAVVTPPYHCEVLKVWMPIPQSDKFQQVSDSRFSTFPEKAPPTFHSESVYGNRFAYFEFHQPRGAQIIRHRFSAKVWNVRWQLDPGDVQLPNNWPSDLDAYLRPQAISKTGEFQRVLHEITPHEKNGAYNLFAAMRWIDKHLVYDHVDASLQADSEHAFRKRHGHCSDYHGLCATMGRSLGFPSRIAYGLALYPKNSPSHCKLEAYLPPYGWVSFDLSETQKMVTAIKTSNALDTDTKQKLAAAARRRLQKGFRENSWLRVTTGSNYELAPKASRAVRVVRTIYAEADGEALPEPDPANAEKREFGWMTVHRYKSDKPIVKAFKDFSTLE